MFLTQVWLFDRSFSLALFLDNIIYTEKIVKSYGVIFQNTYVFKKKKIEITFVLERLKNALYTSNLKSVAINMMEITISKFSISYATKSLETLRRTPIEKQTIRS